MDYEKQMMKAVGLQAQLSSQINTLMSPALNALGLDYFWFVRLMEGTFHISVGITAPREELYLMRKTEDLYFNNPEILAQKQTTVFWDLYESDALAYDMLHKLGLQQGICIFFRKKNYVDVFYVASAEKNTPNIYDLYLNNPQSYLRLVGYFQEKVLPCLPLENKDFFLPYMDGAVLKLPPSEEKSTEYLDKFYDATKLKKFTLHKGDRKFSLSLRELQCLHLLSKGSTSKDIANLLHLSFRTVEHYLSNIRLKVDCDDKAELIKLYRENDVATWFAI
jgi:DNA-binding CsgD family transcriptional regulator